MNKLYWAKVKADAKVPQKRYEDAGYDLYPCFEEDYMVTDRNGRIKRADLIDYINEIKYIERPHWIEGATKAHEIRKKRNLVHAKLGINSDEIDRDTCRMVIDYLRDVIKTRGVEE